MTTIRKSLCFVLGCVVFLTTPAALAQTPQGTAFTYQGDLDQNDAPVNAKVDMAFALFDASTGGNSVGSELDFSAAHGNPVDVQDGSFTVALDFGALAFAGAVSDERYLQVSVNGSVLTPRTKIENAPYALQARTAEMAYAVSNASIGTAQIIATQVQQRVSGNCAVGSSIRSIAQDGSVTCQAGANGTVTSVGSGTGLTGGPITGTGTLGIANGGVGLAQIDTSQVQARVSDSCNSGQKVLAINADGTVVCAADAVGGAGTVTSVNSGTGLTGGPVTASGTLSIANGGVGLAQINTSQVQVRVAGACDLGEYLRGINADGSPICAPVPATQRISLVKNTTPVGPYSAVAIGVNGLPVVASYDATNGVLEVSPCGDPSCVAATFNRVTFSGFHEGLNPAITIGSDQLPIVSNIGTSEVYPYTLDVVHCKNSGCTVLDNAFISAAYSARTRTSIAMGSDDLPVGSFFGPSAELRVFHCSTISCCNAAGCGDGGYSSSTFTNVDTAFSSGVSNAIAIGSDGVPVVAYFNVNQNLSVAHCANVACTGTATLTVVDSGNNVGLDVAIAIGTDGLPIMSYYDAANDRLKTAHCANVACTGATKIAVVDAASAGLGTSIAIGGDGLPIVSYLGRTFSSLKVAHCADVTCAGGATISTIDGIGAPAQGYTALAVGDDGLPLISYYDGADPTNLKFVKCNNRSCQ